MKNILLIRHGATEANERGLYCGSTDLPLSTDGRAALEEKSPQARAMDLTAYKVYISPMRRAAETLEILWGLPAETEADLREMDFGIFEMKSYAELKDTPEFDRWCQGDNEKNVCPGGESGEEMTARVLRAFQRIAAGEENVLLVFHGGPIAAIMAKLFPGEGKSRWEWQPKNGGGFKVFVDEQGKACYYERVLE